MHKRTRLAALGAFTLFAASASANQRDPAAAEALFRSGRVAIEKGDYASACPKFEESSRLDPAVGTTFNLADCDEHIGKVASAWQLFKEVAQRLPHGDERIAIAEARAAALEPRLPRLTLTLHAPLPAGATVLRDGVEMGHASFDLALPVDTGDHVIVVKAPGRSDRQYAVKAVAAQTREVSVEAGPPLPANKSVGAGTSVTADTGAEQPGSGRRTAGAVLLGVGGAGIATSLILGAVALNAKKMVENECNTDKACSDKGLDAADTGRTAATISSIAFGVGLVGAASGLYLLLSGKSDTKAPPVSSGPAVETALLPGGAFVSIGGRL